jgi:hypothetical protein
LYFSLTDCDKVNESLKKVFDVASNQGSQANFLFSAAKPSSLKKLTTGSNLLKGSRLVGDVDMKIVDAFTKRDNDIKTLLRL